MTAFALIVGWNIANVGKKMTDKKTEALKLALELLAVGTFHSPELQEKRTEVIEQGLNALAQPEQEPMALPPVQFEKVAEGIEVGYDFLGGVDIRLGGEFVYVHINYDYRYTHNAARKALAEQIVGLLTAPPPVTESHKRKPWVGLTEEEIEKGRDQTFSVNNPYCPCDSKTMRKAVRWAEAKLKEKNNG